MGLIGLGCISDMHYPGYFKYPHAEVFAVADLNPATARRRAREWGAAHCYTDYRQLLANPDVDAVEIISPHHLHHEMTLAAAEAGKAISLQKPMAMNLRQCQEMINATQQAGVVFRVYENFIFYPPFVQMKELMEEGAIGRPLSVRFRLGTAMGGWHVPLKTWVWRMKSHLGGHGLTLFDDGFHKYSMALALMGKARAVMADVRWWLGGVDTPAAVTFDFENGGVGVFDSGRSFGMEMFSDQYGADEQVEISGEEGTLLMTRCTARHVQRPALLLNRHGCTHAFHTLPATWQDSFSAATRHFVQCLRNGEKPLWSGEDALLIQAMAEAIYESARQGGEAVVVQDYIAQELEKAPAP